MKIKREGEFWVIYQDGAPMARSRSLEVLRRHWPEAVVQGA